MNTRDMLFDGVDVSVLGGQPAWIVYSNPLQLSAGCVRSAAVGGHAHVCPKSSNNFIRVSAYSCNIAPRLVCDDGVTANAAGAYVQVGRTYRVTHNGQPAAKMQVGST